MAIIVEQFAEGSAFATSPAPIVLASGATTGRLLVVVAFHTYTGCPPSISDTLGSSFTKRLTITSAMNDTDLHIWTAPVASTGANTITLTCGCGLFQRLSAYELSGHDSTTPYGGQAGPTANTTNPVKSGSVTPDVNGSFVLSAMRNVSAGYSFTEQAGYTRRYTASDFLQQDIIQAVAGAINPEATVSADPSTVIGASFWIRAAAVGGGPSAAAKRKYRRDQLLMRG